MVQTHRIKTVAIVGCTAVGKSSTALKLAEIFDGVIIGADSMQIYRQFDIGTGKLTKSECGNVEHKMIDVADGDADFSVGDYVELAQKEIADAVGRGKLPLIVGGTGLYVNSLFSGCNFGGAPKDAELRKTLKVLLHFFGAKVMHSLLSEVDSASSQKIAVNDCKRVIRALEIYTLQGTPKSEATTQKKPYDDLTIVLTLPRELLYERINERVKKMFDNGLIDEVKGLMLYKDCGSMQALGYKQIAANPDAPRSELEALTAQKTRNYAKRQMTYFNNMKLNKVFIDARDFDKIRNCIADFLEN
ncbi:MAG: tRNA (adenosine(37)-N6)-dimethylallyltransferase MiaA [Clostridiales bacterium]|nr:tRNA (adenosine(37)-N6)-dimethylallyltransferase MiaA [Clostridiales bacterium]